MKDIDKVTSYMILIIIISINIPISISILAAVIVLIKRESMIDLLGVV